MCRSFTISYTRCGHQVRHPCLCQAARCQRPVYACRGWDGPMREFLQAEEANCSRCQEQSVLRITRTPWRSSDNDNLQQDVPIRSRQGSLPQRYVPTPPPAYTRGYEYVSGYGYGESQPRRARSDSDPSPNEIQRRISEWARRVPAGPLPRLLQAPKESYIGRANTTGFAPYLPQHSIPVLELKAMRLATAEDKAIYTIQDALALELYPEQSLIVIRVPAIYVPRMKSTATASRLDALAILLLFALQPTVLHFAETMISNSQSQDTSLQTEQSSLKQLHTDQNISLHVQMTSALQTIRPEERKNCTLEPNAEEEAYMEEVEACRISEVHSHLIHHADFEEWLVRNIV